MNANRRHEYQFLLENARAAQSLGLACCQHLDQRLGFWSYLRIADDIARRVPAGRLLDWGCGVGQMTWLLRRRGFEVTAFDIGEAEQSPTAVLPIQREIRIVYGSHPTDLPFADATFDAVLSCGVLEHVDEYSGRAGNERLSLGEIFRILKPGGALLIYQLPQRLAWQEAAIRRFRLGYSHPRRFSGPEIRTMLCDAGFTVARLRRFNFLPKNLTGMPKGLRRFCNQLTRPIFAVDDFVSRVPLVNRFAGVLEVTARKTPGPAAP